MNSTKKLRALAILSALSFASASLVQAADLPIVSSTNGNIGTQGQSHFDNINNIYLGKSAGAASSNAYTTPGAINSTGGNIAIGALSLNGSNGGGNIGLGLKTFINGKGDNNFLGGFAAGNGSTISKTIAIGDSAGLNSQGDKNVWLGAAQGMNSTASNTVLIGSNSTVNGNFNYGMGHGLILNGANNSAIGAFNKIDGNNSGALGLGTYNVAAVTGNSSYSIGNHNQITADNTFVVGNQVHTSLANSVILGNASSAETNDVVATPTYTYANGTTVNYAGTNPVGTVSVGTQGQERTITHIAAGRVSAASTDAINGSQLYAANQGINKMVGAQLQNFSKESNKGDARAAALAALHPLAYDPNNKYYIMGGYGHYKNANALALGLGYYAKENLLLTLGTTLNGDTMTNVGLSYKVGQGKTMAPISLASYNVLENRVDNLEAQNKKLQEKLDLLMQKINQ